MACPSASINLNVLLLKPVEEVDLQLAMAPFVGRAGLRMCAYEKFIALRYRLSLDLLAEAFVSAHGADTTCHMA